MRRTLAGWFAGIACATLSTGVLAAPSIAGTRLPTLLTAVEGMPSFMVRPPALLWTPDGSGWLGGRDGNPNPVFRNWKQLGHFSWSSWTSRQARGSGVVWTNTCNSRRCADKPWTEYRATAHAFHPSGGHFVFLTISWRASGGPHLVACMAAVHETYLPVSCSHPFRDYKAWMKRNR